MHLIHNPPSTVFISLSGPTDAILDNLLMVEPPPVRPAAVPASLGMSTSVVMLSKMSSLLKFDMPSISTSPSPATAGDSLLACLCTVWLLFCSWLNWLTSTAPAALTKHVNNNNHQLVGSIYRNRDTAMLHRKRYRNVCKRESTIISSCLSLTYWPAVHGKCLSNYIYNTKVPFSLLATSMMKNEFFKSPSYNATTISHF